MKIAITSLGENLDSKMDARFGRCENFIIYNTDEKNFELIENPAKEGQHGAGTGGASLIADKGAAKVISGKFGPKAKDVLEKLQIEMLEGDEEKTIRENLQELVNIQA